MKCIRVVLGLLCVGVLGAFAEPQNALAQTIYSAENTITVTATVLEHRTIIIDANGSITQISSNTENNITPEVRFMSYGGEKSVLTLEISHQYQYLMNQVQANKMFVMDRQTDVLTGLMPQSLLPLVRHTFMVTPAHIENKPNLPYTLFE